MPPPPVVQTPLPPPLPANALPPDNEAFEGPEKLLEVWFEPSDRCVEPCAAKASDRPGLLAVPQACWERMLDLVHCKILHTLSNQHVDAYLLSESSMFVYPHKLILKTCGTTTLLLAVSELLKIAKDYCKFCTVWRLFYSRKNFMFPDRQPHPHQDWNDEVAFLDRCFKGGSAYKVGRTNGDHWYLYLTTPGSQPKASGTVPPTLRESVSDFAPTGGSSDLTHDRDITVEILMTDLDPAATTHYYESNHTMGDGASLDPLVGGKKIEAATGIDRIYPGAQTDSFLFSPCGFSLNGLAGKHYFTIHVTPEPECSYASFETNLALESHHPTSSALGLQALVQQVVDIFRPGKFSVSVFKTHSTAGAVSSRYAHRMANQRGRGAGSSSPGRFHSGDSTPTDEPDLTLSPNDHLALLTAAGSGGGSRSVEEEMALFQSWRKLMNSLPPWNLESLDDYQQADHILYEFDNYWLRFGYFTKL
ncbi:spermidine resistance protein [Dimargaris verticillata]|uniref:adenosylmethionine decarboxylase n=1 Tax=Dimargaris verticillata TaxID=2761393 RepID=A0A9W8B0L0_9FUNG|nr:spermidine resistance protein [Dimargaris verticillata]